MDSDGQKTRENFCAWERALRKTEIREKPLLSSQPFAHWLTLSAERCVKCFVSLDATTSLAPVGFITESKLRLPQNCYWVTWPNRSRNVNNVAEQSSKLQFAANVGSTY
jgi:hypothetical protein